jgi:hypothetical protein
MCAILMNQTNGGSISFELFESDKLRLLSKQDVAEAHVE